MVERDRLILFLTSVHSTPQCRPRQLQAFHAGETLVLPVRPAGSEAGAGNENGGAQEAAGSAVSDTSMESAVRTDRTARNQRLLSGVSGEQARGDYAALQPGEASNRSDFWSRLSRRLSAPFRSNSATGNDAASPSNSSGQAEQRRLSAEQIRRGRISEGVTSPLPSPQPDGTNDLITGSLESGLSDNQPLEALDRRDALERDPWAALGLRLGQFLMFPTLTLEGGYSTNPDRFSGGEDSFIATLTPALTARSQWERHELSLDLRGTVTFQEEDNELVPDMDSAVALRLDLSEMTTANLRATYTLQQENASSDAVTAAIDEPGDIHTFGVEADITHETGLLAVTGGMNVQRTLYTDATLDTGALASNDDRDTTEITGTLRLASASGSVMRPFVEGEAGRRLYDQTLDRNGFERSSTLYGLRGGMAFDDGALYRGEVALGYGADRPDDNRLDTVQGITLDGNIVWAFSPLTTLTLTAVTDLTPTTLTGSAGALSRQAGARIDHALRRNVNVSLEGRYEDIRYEGLSRKDKLYYAGLGLDWRLNRYVDWTATARYERFVSSQSNRGYSEAAVLTGVRLKR
jgi:hypothetical protein